MSKYLWALLGLGVAGVVIYLVWKYYQEGELSALPKLEEEEEPEIPAVPAAEEVKEELPYTPAIQISEDWDTLAALEYADLHICPVCAMSFPSMSAMLWHVKLDHTTYLLKRTYPRYNKICVLLRILKPDGDPAVGLEVKLYSEGDPPILVGKFTTDSYGCGDFIRMEAGYFAIDIEKTADYGLKRQYLTLVHQTVKVQCYDDLGQESSQITVTIPGLNTINLKEHTWQLVDTWKDVTISAPAADEPTYTPPPPPIPPSTPTTYPIPPRLICGYCGASFATLAELRAHTNLDHSGIPIIWFPDI